MGANSRPTVLIVDDDPQVRQLYEDTLAAQFDTRVAESGERALELVDGDVDVVLLDRRMLGLSGGDVLLRLREAGYDMPVAMVTAVDPDFDIIEMGFDDYILKPVSTDELRDVVETLILRQEYDAVIREYFALVSKVTALEQRKLGEELEQSEAYAESQEQLEAIKEQAKAALDTAIESGKFDDMFLDLQSGQLETEVTVDFAESFASSH